MIFTWEGGGGGDRTPPQEGRKSRRIADVEVDEKLARGFPLPGSSTTTSLGPPDVDDIGEVAGRGGENRGLDGDRAKTQI